LTIGFESLNPKRAPTAGWSVPALPGNASLSASDAHAFGLRLNEALVSAPILSAASLQSKTGVECFKIQFSALIAQSLESQWPKIEF